MDYLGIYDLQYSHNNLRWRSQVAISKAAYDVINEDAGTPNHANRIGWANYVMNNPVKMMDIEMALIVENPTIQAGGDNATDNDIQFVVNGLVDPFANAIASGAIKPE